VRGGDPGQGWAIGLRGAARRREIMAGRPRIGFGSRHTKTTWAGARRAQGHSESSREHPLSRHGVGVRWAALCAAVEGFDHRYRRHCASVPAAFADLARRIERRGVGSEHTLVEKALAGPGVYFNQLRAARVHGGGAGALVAATEPGQEALGRARPNPRRETRRAISLPAPLVRSRSPSFPGRAVRSRRTGCGLLCDVQTMSCFSCGESR